MKIKGKTGRVKRERAAQGLRRAFRELFYTKKISFEKGNEGACP